MSSDGHRIRLQSTNAATLKVYWYLGYETIIIIPLFYRHYNNTYSLCSLKFMYWPTYQGRIGQSGLGNADGSVDTSVIRGPGVLRPPI